MHQGKFLLFCLLAMILAGCPPATHGPRKVDKRPGEPGPFSVEAMTSAIFEIEGSIGGEGHEQMLAGFEKEFRADPRHPFKRFLWAFSIEDRNQAWTELTKITKLNDKFYWAYLGMAIILDSWKVDDQALKNFEKALELGPRIAIGYGRFGKMLLRKGEMGKALEMLQKAVELDPGRLAYRLDLARTLSEKGEKKESERQYLKVIASEKNNLQANRELAKLLESTGEGENALKYFERAVELAPDSYEINLERAHYLKKLDRLEEAVEAFSTACELNASDIECWRTKVAVAKQLDNLKEIIAAYTKILEVDAEDLEASRFMAPIYLQAGDIEKALPAFEVVLAKEPENLEALAGLAEIYEKGGEYSKAIELAEKIVTLEPAHATATGIRERLFAMFHILKEPISGKSPDQVFSRNRSQIAKIYKERLKEKGGLRGELKIKVTVDDAGKVIKAVIDKNTLGDPVVNTSAIWNIRRSVFPAGFGATYDFALTLKPGE